MARGRAAGLFAMSDQVDSAVAYYTVIASSAESAGDTDARNSATLNLGAVLYNGKRYQEAIPVLRRYLLWRPDQMSARQYLASAFRETGQVDSADALMRQSGVAVGVSGGPDTVSAAYLINRGAARFQANEHAQAAEDFERALVAEPTNRLALRNLAATYYTLKNGAKLVEIAGRIVALEPLSETARRLQNQGYIWLNDRTRLEKLSDDLDAMPVALEDIKVQVTATGASVTATAKGKTATRNGATITPAPVTVVFEFLDAGGTPVTTTEVVIPVLMAGLPGPVSATVTGQGIKDWRYKLK
jgi:tetratricopeptide (TPR) repeat protein